MSIYYFEVYDDGTMVGIIKPQLASPLARYIVREECDHICNSYDYIHLYFVDKAGNDINLKVGDAELKEIYTHGHADDLVLTLCFLDKENYSHSYSLHADIRYNIWYLIPPKQFEPKFSEWEKINPFKSIIKIFEAIDKYGVSAFDSLYKLHSELREVELLYKKTRLNEQLMSRSIKDIKYLEYKEGVEKLPSFALENFDSLVTLVLPDSIKEIESAALYSRSLTNIYFNSIIPPKFSPNSFDSSYGILTQRPYHNISLFVPRGALEAYRKACKDFNQDKLFIQEY